MSRSKKNHGKIHNNRHPGRWFGRWLLAASGVAILLGTLVPAAVIGWLRVQVPPFTAAWDWLNLSLPAFNPLHVILYAWMAMLWFLVALRGTLWHGIAVLVVFSASIEVLQLLAPGRTARLADVLNDVLGIAIGLALGAVIARLLRSGGSRKQAPCDAQIAATTNPPEPRP